jgi:RHS repeat-associated protein
LNPVHELAGGTPTANLLTGLQIDEYFTRTDGAGARHFLVDVLGSSLALTDGSGSVQTEYTYEPFGSVTTTGPSSTNTFGFTGRENDGTGLNFYRARYYDPRLQRFIREDPLGVRGGLNMHLYAGNRPLTAVDPLGLSPSPGRRGVPGFLGGLFGGTGGSGAGSGASGSGSGSGSGQGGGPGGPPGNESNTPPGDPTNDPLRCGQNIGQQGHGLPTDTSLGGSTIAGNMLNEAASQLLPGAGAVLNAGSAVLEGGAAGTSVAIIAIQRRNQIEAACAIAGGCAPSPVPVTTGCFR